MLKKIENNKSITYVVPTYNTLEYLKLTVQSFKDNCPNDYLIIFDDAS